MVKSSEVSAPWPLHGAGSDGSVPRQEQSPGMAEWGPWETEQHTLTFRTSQLGGKKE